MAEVLKYSRETLPDTRTGRVAQVDKEIINLYKHNRKFQFDDLFKFDFQ